MPTLSEDLENTLCKPDDQIWIGWCKKYPYKLNWELKDLFDIWMGFDEGNDIIFPEELLEIILSNPTNKNLLLSDFLSRYNPFVALCKLLEDKYSDASNDIDLPNIHLCTFGDSKLSLSKLRFKTQAEDFGLFKKIFIYNEFMLDNSFTDYFKDKIKPGSRGFGYWAWKPYIILESLKQIEDGEILLYLDMGCHLNKRGKKKFYEYWEEITFNNTGFLVTEIDLPDNTESKWTKGDLLDYFGVRNDSYIMNSPQLQSGVIFIRKNIQTLDLIQKWLDIYFYDFELVDDSPSKIENGDDFIENRHDQSILSILLKLSGTSKISFRETYNIHWNLLESKYPILTKRDLKSSK